MGNQYFKRGHNLWIGILPTDQPIDSDKRSYQLFVSVAYHNDALYGAARETVLQDEALVRDHKLYMADQRSIFSEVLNDADGFSTMVIPTTGRCGILEIPAQAVDPQADNPLRYSFRQMDFIQDTRISAAAQVSFIPSAPLRDMPQAPSLAQFLYDAVRQTAQLNTGCLRHIVKLRSLASNGLIMDQREIVAQMHGEDEMMLVGNDTGTGAIYRLHLAP